MIYANHVTVTVSLEMRLHLTGHLIDPPGFGVGTWRLMGVLRHVKLDELQRPQPTTSP